MFKNITRQLLGSPEPPPATPSCSARPAARRTDMAGAAIPASLTERCLNVAAMDENEVWRAFGGHPEGLHWAGSGKNPQARETHGDNLIPAQKPSPWWVHLWLCYRNPFNLLLTVPRPHLLCDGRSVCRRGDCPDGGDLHAAELHSGGPLHQSGGRAEGDGQQHRDGARA